ncbi:MAG: 50S ribosomal protein L29 [Gammaproteobacteria bacterium WSBS_2016_MAG_OTU1]
MSKIGKRVIGLREKTPEAMREELLALRREHFNLRMQKTVQQTAKTHEIRRVRRDIARTLTILSEKERT